MKLSEKSRRHPKRGHTRYPNRPLRPILAPIHWPNTRPERHPNPFSDSFLRLSDNSGTVSLRANLAVNLATHRGIRFGRILLSVGFSLPLIVVKSVGCSVSITLGRRRVAGCSAEKRPRSTPPHPHRKLGEEEEQDAVHVSGPHRTAGQPALSGHDELRLGDGRGHRL